MHHLLKDNMEKFNDKAILNKKIGGKINQGLEG